MKVDLKNEWWLAKRIYGKDLCSVFSGVTDVAIRRDRMRAAIIDRGLQGGTIGKVDTYAALFERLYGERLIPRGPA
jgi:hypothetical protein